MAASRLNPLRAIGPFFGRPRRRTPVATPALDMTVAAAIEPHLVLYTDDTASGSRRATSWVVGLVIVFALFQGLVFAFFAPYLIPLFLIVPALLLGLIIWALPDSAHPPTRTMERCYVALFFVMLMWPNYLAISLPGLPWITLIRLTDLPMVFLLAVSYSQSDLVRQELRSYLAAVPWLWRFMLCFMAITVITLPLSKLMSLSIQSVILTFTNWFAVYVVSVFFFRKKNRVQYWVFWLCGIMVFLGILAIAESHVKHILWSRNIPSFLRVQDPTIIAMLQGNTRRYTNIYRAQTTFESPLGFGEFIALVFPFVLHIILTDYKKNIRIGAALTAGFLIYVALLSGSRSAVLGALVSSMLTMGVWGFNRWRGEKGSLLAPAIVFSYPVAGVFVLASTFLVGKIRNRVWGGAETVSSTQARVDQWHLGVPLILKDPFGHGMNNAGVILNYRLANGQLVIDSYFLKVLLDWGILGFLALFGTMAAGIFYALRIGLSNDRTDKDMSMAIPAAISLFTWVTIKYVNAEESNHPIIFMMLGMITALTYRQSQNRPA